MLIVVSAGSAPGGISSLTPSELLTVPPAEPITLDIGAASFFSPHATDNIQAHATNAFRIAIADASDVGPENLSPHEVVAHDGRAPGQRDKVTTLRSGRAAEIAL